jgi:hypothetical protein
LSANQPVKPASELTATLLGFLQRCVPTYEAAQVLLFFSANRDRAFRPEEIAAGMWPVLMTPEGVREHAAPLATNGLVVEEQGAFRYKPPPEFEPIIGELLRAYNEQPVSLIRAFRRTGSHDQPRLRVSSFRTV